MDFTVTQPEQHEAIEFPVNRDSQILHWDETIHWIFTPNDIETHTQIQLSTCAGADACKVRDALIVKPCLTAWNLQSWPIKPKSNLINRRISSANVNRKTYSKQMITLIGLWNLQRSLQISLPESLKVQWRKLRGWGGWNDAGYGRSGYLAVKVWRLVEVDLLGLDGQ